MTVSLILPRRRLGVWLVAFFSPIVYLLLLLVAASSSPAAMAPAMLVASLFFLIPVAGLAVCEYVVWSAPIAVRPKVGWMVLTLLGILLQFAFSIAIIGVLIIQAIGYSPS